MTLRLNLACGGSRWDGFDNSDTNGEPGTSYLDLASFPYPYKDDSASVVMMSHALFMAPGGESLHPSLGPIMMECHRILEPGGWLRIDDNPLRCYQEGEHVDPGEASEEAQRGYPDDLRISRTHLCLILHRAGFTRVSDVRQGTTLIPAEGPIRDAIVGNQLGHASFTVEAQK